MDVFSAAARTERFLIRRPWGRGSQLRLPMNSSHGKSLLTLVPWPVLSGCPQASGLGVIANSKTISLLGSPPRTADVSLPVLGH